MLKYVDCVASRADEYTRDKFPEGVHSDACVLYICRLEKVSDVNFVASNNFPDAATCLDYVSAGTEPWKMVCSVRTETSTVPLPIAPVIDFPPAQSYLTIQLNVLPKTTDFLPLIDTLPVIPLSDQTY